MMWKFCLCRVCSVLLSWVRFLMGWVLVSLMMMCEVGRFSLVSFVVSWVVCLCVLSRVLVVMFRKSWLGRFSCLKCWMVCWMMRCFSLMRWFSWVVVLNSISGECSGLLVGVCVSVLKL